MKLLLDQNLSIRLLGRLSDLYPESSHVRLLGLDESDDRVIWQFAKENGFTIVSKDAAFNALCLLRGFPPKLLWLRIGNCSVVAVERLLRRNHEAILLFDADLEAGMMALE